MDGLIKLPPPPNPPPPPPAKKRKILFTYEVQCINTKNLEIFMLHMFVTILTSGWV